MLTAIRISDGKKVIGEDIQKDTNARYRCPNPSCKSTVIHNRPDHRVTIGHFKHKASASSCPYNSETELHLRTKLAIYHQILSDWNEKIQFIEPEVYVADNRLRPDVYLETNKGTRLAIEVQATAPTIDKVIRKTKEYSLENIHVLWVIPFEFNRYYERFSQVYNRGSHGPDFSISGYKDKWFEKTKFRLSSWEQCVYWMNDGYLVLWDVSKKFCDGFIVAEISPAVVRGSTFTKNNGETIQYPDRRLKSSYKVDQMQGPVPFNAFLPQILPEMQERAMPYPLPHRWIMAFQPDVWKGPSELNFPPL